MRVFFPEVSFLSGFVIFQVNSDALKDRGGKGTRYGGPTTDYCIFYKYVLVSKSQDWEV